MSNFTNDANNDIQRGSDNPNRLKIRSYFALAHQFLLVVNKRHIDEYVPILEP